MYNSIKFLKYQFVLQKQMLSISTNIVCSVWGKFEPSSYSDWK